MDPALQSNYTSQIRYLMSDSSQYFRFNRYLTFYDISMGLRHMLHRGRISLPVILALPIFFLWYQGSTGTYGYILIAVGTWVSLSTWNSHGNGLPLLPMIAIQHLFCYALPILTNSETLSKYSAEYVDQAGLAVLLFFGSLLASWYLGMNVFTPGYAMCYAIQGFKQDGINRIKRLGFALIVIAGTFQIIQLLGVASVIYSVLPDGMYPVFNAVISAVTVCGFFLISMLMGSGAIEAWGKTLFWGLFAINLIAIASSFLLSAAALMVGAVFVGLIWSTGRVPWKFILVMSSILAFLNFGKFDMRARYWKHADNEIPAPITLTDLPRIYTEWSQASLDLMFPDQSATTSSASFTKAKPKEGQSMLSRIDNLQNLLYVLDAIDAGHTSLLYGKTYALIPPLLIPRFFWPEKPRTHEGQILLNLHFGRQDLSSTYTTYVAWGLLAESCGNFGRYLGPVLLGLFLGIIFSWAENVTSLKLLFSLEGFLALVVFMGMLNSFEMVASVMITSIFQSIFPVIIGSAPFVEWQSSKPPSGT